jgi:hypothetical protein
MLFVFLLIPLFILIPYSPVENQDSERGIRTRRQMKRKRELQFVVTGCWEIHS